MCEFRYDVGNYMFFLVCVMVSMILIGGMCFLVSRVVIRVSLLVMFVCLL